MFRKKYVFLLFILLWCTPFVSQGFWFDTNKEAALQRQGMFVSTQPQSILIYIPVDLAFDKGDYPSIHHNYYKALDKLANFINHYPDYDIAIVSSTDDLATAKSAKRFTQHLSSQIADFLTETGIDSDRIIRVQGLGKSIRENKTQAMRYADRYIKIHLKKQKEQTT